MQLLFIGIYILAAIVLQTTIFARLNIFGIVPDLVLVSVILFSVLNSGRKTTLFSAVSGFLQDILSFGMYLNTIVKVLVSVCVGIVKESFIGNEFVLSLILVLVFTPLSLFFEAAIFVFFGTRQIVFGELALNILIASTYNVALIPILFPILRKISHAK
jgi:rod shape-determining protein MreD